jgi:hypothetical protein
MNGKYGRIWMKEDLFLNVMSHYALGGTEINKETQPKF